MSDHRPRFKVTSRARTPDQEGVICSTEIGVNVVRTLEAAGETTAPVSWHAIPSAQLINAERLSGQVMPEWALRLAV